MEDLAQYFQFLLPQIHYALRSYAGGLPFIRHCWEFSMSSSTGSLATFAHGLVTFYNPKSI